MEKIKNTIDYLLSKSINGFIIVSVSILFLTSCKQNDTKSTTVSEEHVVEVDYTKESKKDFDQRMEWWREAKFSMFIHWGVYAVPAGIYKGKEIPGIGEWIMENAHIPIKDYEKFAKQFVPNKFDANAWVSIMKDAGMKYVIITSKHHDGFGLWDSEVSDYDIVDFSTSEKDILKELSEACKKQGIKFGIYYSIMDWHHPQAQAILEPNYNRFRDDSDTITNPQFQSYVEEYMKPQLKEIIENYDPAVLWFDGEWLPDYTHENGLDVYQYVRSLKPAILINNRVDVGRQSYQGMNDGKLDYVGDFGTPEQEILGSVSTMDWESCMTMNDTWGFKKNDHNWKSATMLIHDLIDVAAKGGNYLLNVGPTAEGLIPEPSVERLERMGDWLSINGEAIYGTEKFEANYKQGDNIRYTKKKGNDIVYAISLKQPNKKILFNYVKPKEGSNIFLLGEDKPLEWSYKEGQGLTINVASDVIKNSQGTDAWVFKIEGNELISG